VGSASPATQCHACHHQAASSSAETMGGRCSMTCCGSTSTTIPGAGWPWAVRHPRHGAWGGARINVHVHVYAQGRCVSMQRVRACTAGRAGEMGAQHSTAQHSTAQHSTAQQPSNHLLETGDGDTPSPVLSPVGLPRGLPPCSRLGALSIYRITPRAHLGVLPSTGTTTRRCCLATAFTYLEVGPIPQCSG